jgi:hypothetical protein
MIPPDGHIWPHKQSSPRLPSGAGQGFNKRVARHRRLMAMPVVSALGFAITWLAVIAVWLGTFGWWPFN